MFDKHKQEILRLVSTNSASIEDLVRDFTPRGERRKKLSIALVLLASGLAGIVILNLWWISTSPSMTLWSLITNIWQTLNQGEWFLVAVIVTSALVIALVCSAVLFAFSRITNARESSFSVSACI